MSIRFLHQEKIKLSKESIYACIFLILEILSVKFWDNEKTEGKPLYVICLKTYLFLLDKNLGLEINFVVI